MAENNQDLQKQINDLNDKMDRVLQHLDEQRLQKEKVEDLMSDLSVVGKDAFQSTVDELDKRNIELNVDDLKCLSLRFLRNIDNFSHMLNTFESMMDFVKDAGPIANEVGVDVIHKFHEFEQKGYFQFIREMGNVFDQVVANYFPEDLRQMAHNIPVLMETMKNATDPEVLKSVNLLLTTFREMDTDNIESYSLWKTFREMRSPEMKKGLGFMITLMKRVAEQNNQKQEQHNQ